MYNQICLYLSGGDSGTICIDHITQRCNIPLNFKSNQIFTETDSYLRKRTDAFRGGYFWNSVGVGFSPPQSSSYHQVGLLNLHAQ